MYEPFIKHTMDSSTFTLQDLTYGDGTTGSNRLKVAMARFLTKHLHAVTEIAATHVTVTNGCSSSIKHLSWAIANPGEGIRLGQPYCRGFVASIDLRTSVNVLPVPFASTDPFGIDAVGRYEATLLQSQESGTPISALMLCNPHNPTGRCKHAMHWWV